ncbi:hypothetical protein [uncultured Aliiroseovarius sp.]|uniref:hypothetical protein n=1 Tax=uncultured Aliiroseovarius sp. TaxID=1658783 RepID=UPI002595DA03|nr:hypothetical protein [uncultured Aliiroseovarius sp.]
MIRRLVAAPLKLALSATLAVALSVAPVSAESSRTDDQNFTAIIGALLGLAALGAILSDNNVAPAYKDTHKKPPKKVHRDRVPKHLILPKKCVRSYRTQQGEKTLFSNRCLKRNFDYYSNLPRACKTKVVARNKKGTYVTRKTYRPHCLNNRGYRLGKFY